MVHARGAPGASTHTTRDNELAAMDVTMAEYIYTTEAFTADHEGKLMASLS